MYREFAIIYDELMYDLEYEKFSDFIKKAIASKKTVLDMGCGTGTLMKLIEDDFEVTGFDISSDMLSIARNKVKGELYRLDMRDFDMGKKFDAIISSGDSLSYILSEEELFSVFKNVKKNLSEDGIFIFDLNTFYKFKNMEDIYVDETENVFYVWENYFDEESRMNYYDINFFVKTGSDSYKRFSEHHVEYAHDVKKVEMMLKSIGFDVKLFDNYSYEGGLDTASRVTFLCNGKNL